MDRAPVSHARLAYENSGVVAFKMGRRQGGPSRTGVKGRIPHHFALAQIWFSPAGIKMVRDVTDEQRSRRPFSTQPYGPRAVGCFSALLASALAFNPGSLGVAQSDLEVLC
jgi:hypothetical protein